MRRFVALLGVAAGLAVAPLSFAQEAPPHGANAGHAGPVARTEHAAHAEHGEEHAPSFDDINWIYGWFGEREGVEPSIAFRPKGMPAPFGVFILDALLLYGFIISKAKKPLADALKNRKANILRGMDEAARMKREAEKRLAEYEEKLARIEDEVERVRREMRAGAEAERVRILEDARARRARMEKDAALLVEQELAAARDELKRELVTAAVSSAASSVKERLKPEDQQRLADEYLAGLARAGGALRGRA
jgi:F-type H+-transporting ATPase subunit b